MFEALKQAIREFILKTLLARVVQEITEQGLTEADQAFILTELDE